MLLILRDVGTRKLFTSSGGCFSGLTYFCTTAKVDGLVLYQKGLFGKRPPMLKKKMQPQVKRHLNKLTADDAERRSNGRLGV